MYFIPYINLDIETSISTEESMRRLIPYVSLSDGPTEGVYRQSNLFRANLTDNRFDLKRITSSSVSLRPIVKGSIKKSKDGTLIQLLLRYDWDTSFYISGAFLIVAISLIFQIVDSPISWEAIFAISVLAIAEYAVIMYFFNKETILLEEALFEIFDDENVT